MTVKNVTHDVNYVFCHFCLRSYIKVTYASDIKKKCMQMMQRCSFETNLYSQKNIQVRLIDK